MLFILYFQTDNSRQGVCRLHAAGPRITLFYTPHRLCSHDNVCLPGNFITFGCDISWQTRVEQITIPSSLGFAQNREPSVALCQSSAVQRRRAAKVEGTLNIIVARVGILITGILMTVRRPRNRQKYSYVSNIVLRRYLHICLHEIASVQLSWDHAADTLLRHY